MKIERINENQIKFTITEEDLAHKNLTMRDLTYASMEAQELFGEIMQRAEIECDFSTTNSSNLIIEATPVREGELMVMVTRVAADAPMPQFGDGFAPFPIFGHSKNLSMPPLGGGLAAPPRQAKPFGFPSQKRKAPTAIKRMQPYAIFKFKDLDQVVSASVRIKGKRIGHNVLYKYLNEYYLSIQNSDDILNSPTESVIGDYGTKYSTLEFSDAFLLEHGEVIIKRDAVKTLVKHLS
ncbi:MAG: adaptor protein MecA [Defluviitaleaceae bacterium]|nr:adaptor protein MecA [Defluviitaleaceae bacterium]